MTRLLADATLPRSATPATGYQQPPLPLKIAILDLLRQPPAGQRPYYPDQRPAGALTPPEQEQFNQVLRRLSVLAIRHFGADDLHRQYNQPNVQHYYGRLSYVADYGYHEPEAALRCRTWAGLVKASTKWHRDTAIRLTYEELERQAAAAGFEDECWDAPLAVHRTGEFTAYLLKTPIELLQESQALSHCVHNSRYREQCRNGACRIFHLQPAGVTAYDPEGQKRYGTTVEIQKSPQGWYVSQHQGYQNRDPDETESKWADQLLSAFLAATKAAYQNRVTPPQ